jgi:hypothetical protein
MERTEIVTAKRIAAGLNDFLVFRGSSGRNSLPERHILLGPTPEWLTVDTVHSYRKSGFLLKM